MVQRNLKRERKCIVVISLQSHLEGIGIPKLVQLLTPKRSILYQEWVTGINQELGSYYPGIYLLRITLPSGISKDRVIKLESNKTLKFDFDLRLNDVSADVEWAYYAKPNINRPNPDRKDFKDNPLFTEIRVLTNQNGNWHIEETLSDRYLSVPIDELGRVFKVKTNSFYQMLEIRPVEQLPIYLRLPPNNRIKILIRAQVSSQPLRYPIEVVVSTENWKMETVLQVIKKGALKLAEDFLEQQSAEHLLREKYVDATAAAIGAYYLYLTGTYKKNVEWFKNLANDFPYLPDGPVIYASQLINKENPSKASINLCRQYFLLAVERGLPVYTIGFKMLREGLIKMSGYFDSQDFKVNRALRMTDHYHRMIDYTKDLTTLIPVTAPSSNDQLYELYSVVPGGAGNSDYIWTSTADFVFSDSKDDTEEERVHEKEQCETIF